MEGAKEASAQEASFEAMARSILDDCFYNIISDIVQDVHRDEKILRMQSAVVIAEEAAKAQMPEPPATLAKAAPPPVPNMKVETPGAVYENGKTLLRGNPLQTTPEVICPHCRLPRLLYPIAGKGSRDPDLSKQYCMLYPYVSKQGHDIYGVPFPTEQAKSKKERELLKQQQRAEKDNTPGSADTGTPPDKSGSFSLNTGTKAAGYIPWHTCPSCKRSLLITRFAQHLEKCLGISGRQSSRNAMAKLSGQNGTGTGNTPLNSRVGTPVPGSQGNGKKSPSKRGTGGGNDDDDGEETAETPVKKKKKSNYIKKADRERMAAEAVKNAAAANGTPTPTSIKIKIPPPASKRLPKGEDKENSSKRERDEADNDGPRKKMKPDPSQESETADELA